MFLSPSAPTLKSSKQCITLQFSREDFCRLRRQCVPVMLSQELTWQATTAKNILDARRKNRRLGSKKSRSGCITCKIRRVKCDEAKPECKRCQSTGRKCDGYQDFAVATRSRHSVIGRQLSQSLGLSDKERRSFDFFLSWTAPRLAGSLDKDFWCGHVLQVARSESFVRDALLAISILYEHPQYLMSFHDVQVDLPQYADGSVATSTHQTVRPRFDENHLNALQFYNRAIRTFKKRMEDGKVTPLLALLSCLLFMCIELIRHNVFAALSLFTRATQLIKDVGASLSEENEKDFVSVIKLMFARLSVLATTYGHPYPIDVPPESVIIGQRTVFASMRDARTALFDLMADSHAFIRDANAWKESLVLKRTMDSNSVNDSSNGYHRISLLNEVSHVNVGVGLKTVQNPLSETGHAVLPGTINFNTGDGLLRQDDNPDAFYEPSAGFEQAHISSELSNECSGPYTSLNSNDLRKREVAFAKRLGQWLDAFQWPRKPVEDTEPETTSHLLMYYHISTIWLSTRLNVSQTVFDNYTYHFREIVRHAEIYIKAKVAEQSTFTFEVGALPPLYFTATKCRVPSLRRRALDLLKQAPKKECMWGATGSAELACCLVAIEEDGLGLVQPDCTGYCANIPPDDSILPEEENRVHDLEILRNNASQAFQVRVTRYSMIDGRLLRRIEDFPI